MKKRLLGLSVLAISIGLAQRLMADDPTVQRRSVTQETYSAPNAQAPAATPETSVPVTQRTVTQEEMVVAQQNPPLRWSLLEGEVTHVDKANGVVEIRLKGSRNHVGVPIIEKRVGIYRHGDHQYALKDVEPGDNVTIRNLNTPSNL